MSKYDVTIIGSGPGGYVSAIRASQLGLKTAIVERADVGGVCLNWGCIPSKALLRNAEVLELFKRASDFGVTVDNLRYDFSAAIDRSRKVVDKLTGGVRFLLKKNNVEYFSGMASLKDPNTIEIADADTVLSSSNVVLATGARFRALPTIPVDGKVVITSREALELPEVPRRVVIVGGGATGVEFAYLYRTYGAEVTLVELLPRLVPLEDEEISEELEKAFAKQGIVSMTGSKVDNVQSDGTTARIVVSNKDSEATIECDKVLVAVGMRGNIEGIGLEELGVKTDRGFITVDERMATSVPEVYAIGDVTGKMLLAHVASQQGIVAVETIAGLDPLKIDYDLMPRATYCRPQIASFGLTESQAKDRGHNTKVGRFPFSASGKALALDMAEGMVKLVVDEELGDVLGAHMIGPEVTELLGEVSLARMLESTTAELGGLVHPHPTISEMLKEAALAADGQAIHM